MSFSAFSIAFAPLVPWWLIAALAAVVVLALCFGVWRRARGVPLRGLAFAVLLLILTNPSLVEEQREPQKDVAVAGRRVVPVAAGQPCGGQPVRSPSARRRTCRASSPRSPA